MSVPLTISIALCTCNGERFLGEQLMSLASQSYLPGELVVCDDASDDGTYALLTNFVRNAPFPVRLYRNQERLGISRNFEQAIRLCTGSVIALCDQDDVWLPEKLARYAECFTADVDWLFCDAQVMDAALLPLGYTLWEGTAFTEDQRQLARNDLFFEVLLKHYVVAGATMAFRSELRDQLLPMPTQWHYDAWLAAVLAATKKSMVVAACMQHYRQHENNALGMKQRSLFSAIRDAFDVNRTDYLATEICRWQLLVERLGNVETPAWVLSQLEAKCSHLLQRAAFPKNRLLRMPFVAGEIARGGYSRFSRNWGSVALDLFLK
jgi:glycosyltransferase involved in cell wall biosynthesis